MLHYPVVSCCPCLHDILYHRYLCRERMGNVSLLAVDVRSVFNFAIVTLGFQVFNGTIFTNLETAAVNLGIELLVF